MEALMVVANATETATSKNDSKLSDARAKLGKALEHALIPEREEWLEQVSLITQSGRYGWIRSQIKDIVDLENGYTSGWTTEDIRINCIDILELLKRFESIVRRRAEEAKKEALRVLD